MKSRDKMIDTCTYTFLQKYCCLLRTESPTPCQSDSTVRLRQIMNWICSQVFLSPFGHLPEVEHNHLHIPRLTESTGKDGDELRIFLSEIVVQANNSNTWSGSNRKDKIRGSQVVRLSSHSQLQVAYIFPSFDHPWCFQLLKWPGYFPHLFFLVA